jgi:hypothetical protein
MDPTTATATKVNGVIHEQAPAVRPVAQPGERSLLVDTDAFCALTCMSPRKMHEEKAKGNLPPCVKAAGKKLLWRRADVELWVECGCDRARFDAALATRKIKK